MKKKKTKKTLPAMTTSICAVVVILWIACMYAITSVTAQNFLVGFIDMGDKLINNTWNIARFSTRLDESMERLPGYEEYVLWDAVRSIGINSRYNILYDVSHRPLLKIDEIKADSAAAIFDADGNIMAYPSNFFIFPYYYDEDYKAGDNSVKGFAVCVLDRQFEPDMSKHIISQTFGSLLHSTLYYRFTGELKNNYFTVYKIEYCLNPKYTESGEEEWRDAPSYGIEMPEGLETVVLYTENILVNTYNSSRSFKYQDVRMEDIGDYLEQVGPNLDYSNGKQFSLTDFVYGDSMFYWNEAVENSPKLEYRLTTVLLASPWRSAFSSLRDVYIFTFIIMLIGILRLRKTIKREVAGPVAAVNEGIANGWIIIRSPDEVQLKFTEQAELLEHYDNIKTKLMQDKDKIARLERAVKYAEEAEQNRRQMTSNIAHELKTPLAVIHSYAEGLKERIAEDKRDKYMDIILSETERMDGMVLEMLALSRLEAGKVKLSREDFSLSKLAASVFERLKCASEAKDLKITYELKGDCTVNADMQRIEQVITNFAVNAVKYTPQSGKIRVAASKMRGETTFTIENDSLPLSSEELSKVWNTFYRVEEARTGDGTGLGLAIAKSIIDLHGGRCFVRNTETGVEFGFII